MAAAADDGKRSWATRSLSQLVPGVTRAAYRKRSPAGATLMADWAAIVGPALAARTEPRRLSGTTLTIACAGPTALELQHGTALLAARINAQAGRVVVERIRFVQAPLTAPASPPSRRVPAALEPVPGVAEGPLHDALARLRAALTASNPAHGRKR